MARYISGYILTNEMAGSNVTSNKMLSCINNIRNLEAVRFQIGMNCALVTLVDTLHLLCQRFLLNTNAVHAFLNGGIKTEQLY